MSELCYIYGLIDPRDGRLRYVGKAKDPYARLATHRTVKEKTYKKSWLTSLANEGLVPEIRILETVTDITWQEREQFWIDWARHTYGDAVTNATIGGEGRIGCAMSEEARKKISKALRGRTLSEETRRRIGQAQRGKTVDEEVRRRISVTLMGHKGQRPSEKAIAALVARNKMPISEERRAKMRLAHVGWKPSVELCQIISKKCSGKGNGSAKLTESQVLEIRRRYSFRKVTGKILAAEYGVSKCTIGRILRGESWVNL